MALANVAWLFAANGRRVLMIDWDLEAPGLHRYFHPFLNDPKLTQSRGLLDLLLDYVTFQQTDPKKRPADINDLMSLANVGRVALPVDYDFGENGCLHIVGPGIQNDEYAEKVQNFDWRTFYQSYDGARFVDKMAKYIRNQYEIAFVDSRTGVADTSGICTLQIPDKLVFCFTYNRQSIEGVQMIASTVMSQEKPPSILLRPMRVEKDVVGIRSAQSYARAILGSYTGISSEKELLSYWDAAEVPHYPAYGFEEILTVFGEVAGGRNNLLADMELLASEIENAPIRMPPLPDDFRQRMLARFRWGDADEAAFKAVYREATMQRMEKSIQAGLERERHKPVSGEVHTRFINRLPMIPPLYFQDRHVETGLIGTFLKDESLRLMTVVGRAGVGKTAIVCRLLRSLEAGKLPDDGGALAVDSIVYLTGRTGHPVSFPNLFADLCKLLPKTTAKRLDQLYRDAKQSTAARMQALLAAFPSGRTIVLLDNFEDVVDAETQAIKEQELDEALRTALEAPPHGVKFLLTTRVAPQPLLRTQPALQRTLELEQGLVSPYAEEVLKAMDPDGTLGLHDPEAPLDAAREATRGAIRARWKRSSVSCGRTGVRRCQGYSWSWISSSRMPGTSSRCWSARPSTGSI